jgi:hypothetical protein
LFAAAFALLFTGAYAANAHDSDRHAIRVGDPETKLISELGTPQRTISVEDSAGNVVGKHLYYVVETGSVRFYIEDGHILEITNERERH